MQERASLPMPEMLFHIRWPDGEEEACYSPSLVVKDHLTLGATYAVQDFRDRCRTALLIASDRVKAKYGSACSRALGQLHRIEESCAKFSTQRGAAVQVESFEE
jgi:uncharacterized repeat protein (TIGR04042 family)